jgi:hypothetical protein
VRHPALRASRGSVETGYPVKRPAQSSGPALALPLATRTRWPCSVVMSGRAGLVKVSRSAGGRSFLLKAAGRSSVELHVMTDKRLDVCTFDQTFPDTKLNSPGALIPAERPDRGLE